MQTSGEVTVDDRAVEVQKGRFLRNELRRETYETTAESSKANAKRASNLMAFGQKLLDDRPTEESQQALRKDCPRFVRRTRKRGHLVVERRGATCRNT